MAKNIAPLFGFDGAGQLGRSLVYSRWRGVNYTRRYVIPANPRTTRQVAVRDAFQMLGDIWKFSSVWMTDPWNLFATGQKFTGKNAFMSANIGRYKLQAPAYAPVTSIAGLIVSPGARGGMPPTAVVPTPSTASVSFAVSLPAVPPGWSIVNSVAIVIPDQAPSDPFPGAIFTNEEESTPETNVVSGLTTETDYVSGVFLTWERPDGGPAYSVSLADTFTTT